MSTCTQCQKTIDAGMRFCPACGAPAPENPVPAEPDLTLQPEETPAPVEPEKAEENTGNSTENAGSATEEKGRRPGVGNDSIDVIDQISGFTEKMAPGNDFSGDFSPEDIEENKNFAAVAYFAILFLVPLLLRPESKYARFHANQGIVLAIAECLAGTAALFIAIIPFIGPIIFMLASVAIGIVGLGATIIGACNALSGRARELPFIGRFRIVS